jgi:hypothetical protein
MPLVPSSPPDEADPVRCATFPPSRRATTTISPSRVAAAGGAVRARSASRARVDPPAGHARGPTRAAARSLTPPPLPSARAPASARRSGAIFGLVPSTSAGDHRASPRPSPGGGFGAYPSPGGHHPGMFANENGAEYTQYECVPPTRDPPPTAPVRELPTSAPNRVGYTRHSLHPLGPSVPSRPRPPPRAYTHHPLPRTTLSSSP